MIAEAGATRWSRKEALKQGINSGADRCDGGEGDSKSAAPTQVTLPRVIRPTCRISKRRDSNQHLLHCTTPIVVYGTRVAAVSGAVRLTSSPCRHREKVSRLEWNSMIPGRGRFRFSELYEYTRIVV